MGYEYIILDLEKLKIVRKRYKALIFNSINDARNYALENDIEYRIIRLQEDN